MEAKTNGNCEPAVLFCHQRDFQADSDQKDINFAFENCENDAEYVGWFPRTKVPRDKKPWICLAIVLTILFGCILFVLISQHYFHTESNIKLSDLNNQDAIFKQLTKELELRDSFLDEKMNITKDDIVWYKRYLENERSEANNTAQALEAEIENNKEIIRDLEDKLQTLTQKIEEMKRSFGTLRDETNKTEQFYNLALKFAVAETGNVRNKLEQTQELGCGGIIHIPTTYSNHYFSYKGNEQYDNNESCLWTIQNANTSMRPQTTFKLKLVLEGFADTDGLYAFKWGRDAGLSSQKLSTSLENEFNLQGLFLSFTSNGIGQGTGFYIRISIISSVTSNYFGINHFYTIPNRHSVSSYESHQLDFIAVQPQLTTTFTVVKVLTESSYDFLYVHEIQEGGTHSQRGRLHGSLQYPLEFSTMNPILCIFTADSGGNVEGFDIRWT